MRRALTRTRTLGIDGLGDDQHEVTVTIEIDPGCAVSWGAPGEPPSYEVVAVVHEPDGVVVSEAAIEAAIEDAWQDGQFDDEPDDRDPDDACEGHRWGHP